MTRERTVKTTKHQQHQLTLSRLGLSLPLRAAQQRHEQRREEPRSHGTPHPFRRAVLTRHTSAHATRKANYSDPSMWTPARATLKVRSRHVSTRRRRRRRTSVKARASHPVEPTRVTLLILAPSAPHAHSPPPQLPALLFSRLLAERGRYGTRARQDEVSACIRLGSNDDSQTAI